MEILRWQFQECLRSTHNVQETLVILGDVSTIPSYSGARTVKRILSSNVILKGNLHTVPFSLPCAPLEGIYWRGVKDFLAGTGVEARGQSLADEQNLWRAVDHHGTGIRRRQNHRPPTSHSGFRFSKLWSECLTLVRTDGTRDAAVVHLIRAALILHSICNGFCERFHSKEGVYRYIEGLSTVVTCYPQETSERVVQSCLWLRETKWKCETSCFHSAQ